MFKATIVTPTSPSTKHDSHRAACYKTSFPTINVDIPSILVNTYGSQETRIFSIVPPFLSGSY
ncbi:hypothetical protein M378DRAFT_154638 [Amanita muscaria Koide BX008]|uniref:Uncharacterized protein n=1 Tax=Amanita muscaria (strain Koide BX008) TaxID=946122 RepID=A0A0C2X9V3_AMAMK|nr:hypothetical protein M378DRAFT_154638 [Amanita muscaria Koide BX008]